MAKSVFTDANSVVVEVLVAARKAAGLRQQDLAELVRKPQSFISRIENGNVGLMCSNSMLWRRP